MRTLREHRPPWPRQLIITILPWFGASAWWSRSAQNFNHLLRVSLQSCPENVIKSVHNLLNNCWISDWTVNMVILIATKIWSLIPFTTLDPSIKFYRNLLITFLSNVANRLTNWQTERQTKRKHQKYNLLAKEVINAEEMKITWHILRIHCYIIINNTYTTVKCWMRSLSFAWNHNALISQFNTTFMITISHIRCCIICTFPYLSLGQGKVCVYISEYIIVIAAPRMHLYIKCGIMCISSAFHSLLSIMHP